MPVTQSGTRWKKTGSDTSLTVTMGMPSQVERCLGPCTVWLGHVAFLTQIEVQEPSPLAPEPCQCAQAHSRGANTWPRQMSIRCISRVISEECRMLLFIFVASDGPTKQISVAQNFAFSHTVVFWTFKNFSLLFLLYVWFYCFMTWKYFIAPF